ncbi:MAG: spore protease YyaC [Clostridia bacterium]|nr:spore protease YyaC [Clostridia bacterium]
MTNKQVYIYNPNARHDLAQELPPREQVVYFCIGTQKVVADSLGPTVGTILQEKMKSPIFVYGYFEADISALNLLNAYEFIRTLHPDKKVLVIDAGVGDESEIGRIIYKPTPLLPGAATNKNLPSLGHYSIVGIVALRGLEDFYQSTSTKRELINDMAQVIADAILSQCG